MTHILDNPIWNAFNTTNKSLAEGNECASGDELVAMAGQRMQPDPYTEISAVCTHPDHFIGSSGSKTGGK